VTVADVATIRLGWAQSQVAASPARFRVWIAGRRSGKTYLAGRELREQALASGNRMCWYIAPSYKMAKDIAWVDVKRLLAPWAVKVNETELSITLLNGSLVALHGAENPDRLVGRGLDFVVLDEFALLDKMVWDQSIRPALADRAGRALFISSPRGFNWAYDFFLTGQEANPEWASWQTTTLEGGRVAAEEVDASRASMDPRLFAQEFLASFETLLGRVYSNFDRRLHLDPEIADRGAELLVGMDFNVHPMSAVVCQKAADEVEVLDAIAIPTSNTEEMADELVRRYPGRRIVICPDPSGNARKTSAPVGQTDFTILRRRGFTVDAPSQAPLVVDRINNVQALLQAADGRRRMRLHPRALHVIKTLEGLTYKDGTSTPDKDSGLDHMGDALGYLCWQRFNVLRPAGWTAHRNPL
jgi:hypothetical protein